jgi:cell wall assembly regulator SMI1
MMTEIAQALERIFAWGDTHIPRLRQTIRPGATQAQIEAIEALIGRALPEDVRMLYRLHDGQSEETPGLFYGMSLLSLEQVALEWSNWRDVITDDPGLNDEITGQSSWPVGAIDPVYINLGWIPITKDFGGNNIGVDLVPGPKGIMGQVIVFGRDEDQKFVIGNSIVEVLNWIADHLESGNFIIQEHDEGAGEVGIELNMRDPDIGHFHDAARALLVGR